MEMFKDFIPYVVSFFKGTKTSEMVTNEVLESGEYEETEYIAPPADESEEELDEEEPE